jgi:hypothetical protein
MADMVSRIKRASYLLCWSEPGFCEPVNAYLKRKLRHVMGKVSRGPQLPARKMLVLENGADYYASVGELGECGRLIYFLVKLVHFKLSLPVITALVQTPAQNGKCVNMLLKYNESFIGTGFVPKAEFEKDPLGIVCKDMVTTADVYNAPPADWGSYENDMKDVLMHLATCCEQFKMDVTVLPKTGRSSPYSISNGVSTLQFTEIDQGMSFQPFFSEKMTSCNAQQREKLLQTPALREINRCFFIHLGVALGLHPVAMQAIFRGHSDALLKRIQLALSQKTHEDDQRFDEVAMLQGALQSVLSQNDMIEAPILSIIWPQEFQVHQ